MTPEQVLSMSRSDEKVQAALLLPPTELTELVKAHIEINPLSKSSLVNFYTSPRKYIEYIYGEKEDKEAWILGRAVECLLLECQYDPETKIWTKEVFDKKYVIAEKPDCRNKDNKAMWEGLLNDAKKNKQTLIPQSLFVFLCIIE